MAAIKNNGAMVLCFATLFAMSVVFMTCDATGRHNAGVLDDAGVLCFTWLNCTNASCQKECKAGKWDAKKSSCGASDVCCCRAAKLLVLDEQAVR
uniref:Knottin scorpion toxin-like domain-containing protein n=1 Tax=Oryza glumipatula TaxID=40148 RepID=A0A0E0ADX9_9ORYZ